MTDLEESIGAFTQQDFDDLYAINSPEMTISEVQEMVRAEVQSEIDSYFNPI
ncbi:UNKNOWN [Stylonychia lemnae]|uniref:Uncharacterized protein n=1 Tax=Stylonychia lemnae TaxID=5949 RepID=A0A077ZQP6_STYLE|nr:UNKNOWN [Stylonychia lemnae]|eukprot:CDW72243.1 UNKNOWN [Stylonychia lemnae]